MPVSCRKIMLELINQWKEKEELITRSQLTKRNQSIKKDNNITQISEVQFWLVDQDGQPHLMHSYHRIHQRIKKQNIEHIQGQFWLVDQDGEPRLTHPHWTDQPIKKDAGYYTELLEEQTDSYFKCHMETPWPEICFNRIEWKQTVRRVKVGLLFNCKEVESQSEEPDSCNCKNKVSNHFLVWLIRYVLRSLSAYKLS